MSDDWLLNALTEIERTAEVARQRLAAVLELLAPTRADRAAGVPLADIAEQLALRGADPRRNAAAAFHDYEQAVAALRAQVVRALVDDEGASISELARRMNLSRQSVKRLYEAGES